MEVDESSGQILGLYPHWVAEHAKITTMLTMLVGLPICIHYLTNFYKYIFVVVIYFLIESILIKL